MNTLFDFDSEDHINSPRFTPGGANKLGDAGPKSSAPEVMPASLRAPERE